MTNQSIIKASALHRSAGKMLKRVALEDEHLIVERDGYPVAVLLSYQEYEKLMAQISNIKHRELVYALGQEAEKQRLNEEQLNYDLEKDKRKTFKDVYGNQES